MIRISGEASLKIAGSIFDRSLPEPGRFKFGTLVHDNHIIDQTVLTYFSAPNSYTGQDVIEISTHGSPLVVSKVLEFLYRNGARPAQPGEFTYRAYLNNKMDLTQAEAVSDLISSMSDRAAEQAMKQLQGELGDRIRSISERVLKALVACELELDFVEDDTELMDKSEKLKLVNEAIGLIEELKPGYASARLLREGVKVVITGPPNVGKSTLFNRLVGDERAITHQEPGTTRDVLQATCMIRGIEFRLFDTAGIYNSEGEVEHEGIRRAKNTARSADIIIEVFSVDHLPGDYDTIDCVSDSIKVINKIDLEPGIAFDGFIPISAQENINLDELIDMLYKSTRENDSQGALTISRERHFLLVSEACEALERSVICLKDEQPAELVSEELRVALYSIDQITGERHREDLLDSIFAEFCIGK